VSIPDTGGADATGSLACACRAAPPTVSDFRTRLQAPLQASAEPRPWQSGRSWRRCSTVTPPNRRVHHRWVVSAQPPV